MKILCGVSGIEFNCDHIPVSLTSRETVHPIFYVPQKKLLGLVGKWAARELTPTDAYLLFLSLLNSTELIEWRTPVIKTHRTDSIVANNMEPLVQMVGKMNVINHPSFVLSKIAVSNGSNNLDNVKYWIQNWNESYHEFQSGYKNSIKHDKIVTRERALEKLIRGLNMPASDREKQMRVLARHLSEWAAEAGCFPNTTVMARDMKTPISLSEYWKEIIIACVTDEKIFNIRKGDLEDLIEHCEENMEAGTIYHAQLMTILRNGMKKQANYLGLGDIDISDITPFTILNADASVEEANKIAMINAAPEHKPMQNQYPNYIQYARAKVAWEMAQEYNKGVK